MNESVEELLDEEQEDLFEYQEVSFKESDDTQDFLDMNDDNHSAAFKEAVSNDSTVAKKELHEYDEASGMESDDKFNIVVKEDKILVSQETSDEKLVEDNEAIHENFKGTTSAENDDQRSLIENDGQRSLIENDDQKRSIDETDDKSNTEDDVVLNKDEEQIVVHYDHTEWAVVGLHDKTLEIMFEDY